MTNTSHTTPEETQRFHGERVEARQRERADTSFFRYNASDHRVSQDETPEEFLARVTGQPSRREQAKLNHAADALFTAILLDIIAHAATEEPETQERITPFDNTNEPPFFKFWEKLNAGLRAAGKPEAGYKAAKTAFDGGETPVGSLTFVGKEWDGLRAVPGRDGQCYYGEFRVVNDDGTIWNVVANKHGLKIAYVSAEEALKSAKLARQHSEGNNG